MFQWGSFFFSFYLECSNLPLFLTYSLRLFQIFLKTSFIQIQFTVQLSYYATDHQVCIIRLLVTGTTWTRNSIPIISVIGNMKSFHTNFPLIYISDRLLYREIFNGSSIPIQIYQIDQLSNNETLFDLNLRNEKHSSHGIVLLFDCPNSANILYLVT